MKEVWQKEKIKLLQKLPGIWSGVRAERREQVLQEILPRAQHEKPFPVSEKSGLLLADKWPLHVLLPFHFLLFNSNPQNTLLLPHPALAPYALLHLLE